MPKQRMTALDVRATVEEMNAHLIGMRLLNLYDLTPGMFLFKFGQGESKRSVLLNNSIRMHLTVLNREKPKVPSQFTLKLRKHVRAWRLDSVRQLQHDRTIDMCFGVSGSEGCFHIIVELFSQGNIILTDHEYRIMMLFRTPKAHEVDLKVKSIYPVVTAASPDRGAAAAAASGAGENEKEKGREEDSNSSTQDREQLVKQLKEEWDLTLARNDEQETVRSTLSGVCHLGPNFADHIIALSGVKNEKKKDLSVSPDDLFGKMKDAMIEAFCLSKQPLKSGGYLIKNKSKKGGEEAAPAPAPAPAGTTSTTAITTEVQVYDDFTPILLAQHTSDASVTAIYRDSFGQVCEEFFLPTEVTRIEQQNSKKKGTALSKREKFERDHARRVDALEREAERHRAVGEMIVTDADRIDEAIGLINGALAAGIQWDALKSLLKRRHAEGHAVAYMIHGLSLERNSISVLLERALYDDEDDGDVEPLVVEVELDKTAHANAAQYFAKAKANAAKLEKTLAATEKAAAGAGRKGASQAAKQKSHKQIVLERQRNWWEKFLWFRTSAGDVVLQGKDAQTTELLVRRVMRLGDIFVHCGEDKCFPCLIRPLHSLWAASSSLAPQPQPVSMASIEEAASWVVSNSPAWERKQSVGAWWVYASQITGGTATGCYLFEGERHDVRPQPLALGCGLLFCVSRDVRSSGGTSSDSSTTGTDAARTLRDELPSVLLGDVAARQQDVDYIAADAAQALKTLPPLSTFRPAKPPQQQQQSKVPSKKGGAASDLPKNRNSRANKALKEEQEEEAKAAAAAPGEAGEKPLNKYQLKKLKRIKEKYGDQDEDDIARGALLNGNKLAKVQQRLLEEEAARKAEIAEQERLQRKERRKRRMEKGKLRIRVLGEDEDEEDYEEDEEFAEEWTSGEEEEEEEGEEEGEQKKLDNEKFAKDVKTARDAEKKKGSARGKHVDTMITKAVDNANEVKERNVSEALKEARGSTKRQQPQQTPAEVAAADVATAATYDMQLRQAMPFYTRNPLPDDVVLHALAVCAPYQTIIHCAYREELCVGSAKKGQVAQAVLTRFRRSAATAGQKANTSAAASSAEGNKQRKDQQKGKPHQREEAPTAAVVADGKNESLVTALEHTSLNDVIDQLRGNVKPRNLRIS